MYAVIATGGKQYRVAEGEKVTVERVGSVGSEVEFAPVLLVDGDAVLATPQQLDGATVVARVVADAKGPKINGFTYKPKANQRKRWGHRQKLATLEITSIRKG